MSTKCLCQLMKRVVVVLDNLPAYKITDVRAAIHKVGASLFLPPDSPNRIERPRSAKSLSTPSTALRCRIGQLLDCF